MKKKVTFGMLILMVILSTLSIASGLGVGGKSIGAASNRFFLVCSSIALLAYYLHLDKNPQLVSATVNHQHTQKSDKQSLNKTSIKFTDVAGLDEVKEELFEVIDFIRNEEKYRRMGAKIPRGILFHGPPGTGKTLLASAVAGETNASFFSASGSEFVEKYVGVGAKRIRELFEKARKDPPSIIFIDELDAIGGIRNMDSNTEKDQTLNQLLVEMNGINSNETVIVIGATNRIDLLDDALLRPGRFDRHMFIGNPNVTAREEILKVHTKNKPIDDSVNIKELAKRTHGLSGAHLANIANEAAILAVRQNKTSISVKEFSDALERVIAGIKVKNPSVLEKERKVVAYHEAGHAFLGYHFNCDAIEKISIVPRGKALGYVLHSSTEDRYLMTKTELENRISTMLGGMAAEELFFKDTTSGAKEDLSNATGIATEMVCHYGMGSHGKMYLKHEYHTIPPSIAKEINQILDSSYIKAKDLLLSNSHIIDLIAQKLLEKEVIDGKELYEIIKGGIATAV